MDVKIAWAKLNLRVIKLLIQDTSGHFLLCADETVEGKAGIKTHGIERFYSSIQQQPIRSVCLFGFWLVSVKSGISLPVVVKQVVKNRS